MTANWNLFRNWEIREKKAKLRSLSSQKALATFEELYSLQQSLSPEELEKIRGRRLEYLIKLRKRMDSLKEKLK